MVQETWESSFASYHTIGLWTKI